jgi:hypothetical protein
VKKEGGDDEASYKQREKTACVADPQFLQGKKKNGADNIILLCD